MKTQILSTTFITTFILVFLFAFVSFVPISSAQNSAPKKIHLINMLDYYSDYSNQEGYAMRLASANLKAYFESKLTKLSYDIPNVQIEIHNIFDEPSPKAHDPYTEIEKNRFSKNHLVETLQALSCEEDMVVVVYNGHGFTTSNKPAILDANGGNMTYPNLVFHYSRPSNESHYIPYEDILCVLQQKKPAMIVSVISACQINVPEIVETQIAANYDAYTKEFLTNFDQAGVQADYLLYEEEAAKETRTKELFDLNTNTAYNSLQANQVLSIELLSCSKGEFTWVDAEGGHFMTSFIDSFGEALESPTPTSWEIIAANTQFKTEHRINAYNIYESTKGGQFEKHEQSPQCKVYVRDANDCSKAPISRPLPLVNNDLNIPTASNQTFFEYEAQINGKRKTPLWLARRFVKLGESYRVAGSPDQAIKILDTAIPVLKANKDTYRLATAYERLGLSYRDKKNKNKALQYLKEAKVLYHQMKVAGSMDVIDGLIEQLR